ncbi:MAG: DUF4270 family protein [Saprospiraceae bacterium]
MKKYWGQLFSALLVLTVVMGSCADPTFVGSELLEDDRVDAVFTDTVTIHSRTVRGDSVVTYPGIVDLGSYLFGDYQDPHFGRTYSEIYVQPTLEISSFSFLTPNFKDVTVDSVVLVLPYSADGFYGNTEVPFSLDVYELTDSLSLDSIYYSSTKLNYSTFLGSKTFLPRLDSITFIDYRTSSPDTVSLAQLRIPMDRGFGFRLAEADTSVYLTNTAFLEYFKGMAIVPSAPTPGMISFDLVPSGGSYDGGIYVYFQRDSVPLQYRFPISYYSPVVSHFENDYAGATVESFINNPNLSDSLAVVQGTEGLMMELEFPNLEGLQDVILNKAELLIPIGGLENDDTVLYPPADHLYAYYFDESSNSFRLIEDVLLPASGTLDNVFGGVIIEGSGGQPDYYRMNISIHMQEMLKDDRENDIRDVIYLTAAPRAERASRAVLYGASHPQFPVKLNLTYTTQ